MACLVRLTDRTRPHLFFPLAVGFHGMSVAEEATLGFQPCMRSYRDVQMET